MTALDMISHVIPGYDIKELVCESYPNVLYRANRVEDGADVVIKTLLNKYPKREDIALIRREYFITNQAQAKGVIQLHGLVQHGQGGLAIVLEEFGVSLENYLLEFNGKGLPISTFLPIAIQLADVLSGLHKNSVIHKDINPSNIVIRPKSGEVRLIDFGSATELSQERLGTDSISKRIEGSLPYISPEQTGRINREIDYRTDFYSLGIAFYQLLTGKLPFTANDPLEWVHAQIVKEADPARSINEEIPTALSDLIAKLMAKNVEDRYQSASGMRYDLQLCLEKVNDGISDFTFKLGEYDFSNQFHIIQKLYGRDKEVALLEGCFANASNGAVEFCLVTGFSGMGKTALVNELSSSIITKRGYLIQGKFEQFKQNSAYVTISNAFRDLIRQLLGETEERLNKWRVDIKEALGLNGQLIIEMLPELELIIGKQPSVQDLPPSEKQNRFQNLFLSFVGVFANKEHPLVIFMDDVQWSDVPTLNLLNKLVTNPELSHLFIIGTYRDNEVDNAHPLEMVLREIKKKRFIKNVIVSPLDISSTSYLIRDSLRCNEARSIELAQVVFEKSGGNPFFTVELLKNLYGRHIIFFNSETMCWDWENEKVNSVAYSDNVIDILLESQDKLDESTQETLKLAAVIGTTFDLKTLSIIRNNNYENTVTELHEAISSNMIIPLDEGYKLIGLDEIVNENEHQDFIEELNPHFRFQHDRVQQAAYSQISPSKLEEVHLSIGRLILNHSSQEELEERLVEVVGHLNAGRNLVSEVEDKLSFSGLNLRAGVKVKNSSAYLEALHYLEVSNELLGESGWKTDYALTWNLYNELQQCHYLTGDLKKADSWTEEMLEHSKTDIEKGLLLASRTRQYATTGRMVESIDAALLGLTILGYDFIKNPTANHVEEEVETINKNLDERVIADLINLPENKDQKVKIANQLIMEIFPAAFLSGSGEMFPYLVLKSVNIALNSGNSPESAFAYAAYGMILCGYFEDAEKGFEYGELAVKMIDKFDDLPLKSRIFYLYTMFVHHWSNHWSSMTPWFQKGIEAGYQSGDLLYLAYSAQDCIIWDPKLDLETASEEHKKLLAIVKECEYQDSLDSGTLFLQMQLNFQGLTDEKYSLSDKNFNEQECLDGMIKRQFMTGISNYHVYMTEVHLMYNDPIGAMTHMAEQDQQMGSIMALPQMVRYQITSFLVRSLLLSNANKTEQEKLLSKMKEGLVKMTSWAKSCPENFEHLRLFMKAELASFSGSLQNAISLYEQSIANANEQGFRRDEAMANEFAARFLVNTKLSKAAEGYMQAAHYIYYQWGAHRKVEELESKYKHLLNQTFFQNTKSKSSSTIRSSTINSSSFDSELLDISSVLRASQIISGELVLNKLLKDTLNILIENAGAQKGMILESRDGALTIQASQHVGDIKEQNSQSIYDANGLPILPINLITTALRTSEPIVIDNASKQNAYSTDLYIREKQPLSIMCVPLPSHGKSQNAVYFENNLTENTFTSERVQIINLLASQASISMENARIYEEQGKLLKAQKRFVPTQFLEHLGHDDIAKVTLGESVSMNMSVLFLDIRDFTPLVEKLSPEGVIELLNRFFSEVGEPITQSGGFIDSYAGDALLALYPIPAQEAVLSAVELCSTARKFNAKARALGEPELKIGVGINTGPLVLGTMGGNTRMQCTVLGDTVNLASRIESLTKHYGAKLLISQGTFDALKNPEKLSVRKIDRVAVKGKNYPVTLYEILDAEEPQRKKAKELTRPILINAMDAYFNRDFDESLKFIEKSIQLDPQDNVLNIFAARCKKFIHTPPPVEWEGYEKFDHK